ncbi:GNAT family N-acetyltransferase [Bacillus glycinifermentans]|uniref:GNAT family N-acetyltransferase n=1 Tax=Bacillus glycinifermentans TaxID=1664069 RepID=UPI001FF2CCB9|nr:hypothetical protein [Bacillus glycinifermentans]MEC3608709.1 hypothetical protein [Bacillus glycinifermentans]UOY88064.1 hypothetical protein MW696_18865 [Bacillus glycinifermentans]
MVTDWTYSFSEDAFLEAVSRKQAENIAAASVYLWEDRGKPSMARKARPTENGIAVNFVFTPKHERNKGYASSCVAAFSRKLLDEGFAFCCLYTDADNPTSNKIHTVIGYRPLDDAIAYVFDEYEKS